MKKISMMLFMVIASVLAASGALGFSAEIVPSKIDTLIYPQDKSVDATIILHRDMLDNIENIEYTFTVSGPARISDGSNSFEEKISKLNDTYEKTVRIDLTDTNSVDIEIITLSLSGEYVKNSLISGGKKTFSIREQIHMISTDKVAIVQEKKQLQEDIDVLKKDYQSCLAEVNQSQAEISLLNNRNQELQITSSGLQSALDNYVCPPDRFRIPFIAVAIIAGILLLIAIALAYMCFGKGKQNSGPYGTKGESSKKKPKDKKKAEDQDDEYIDLDKL